MDTLNISTNNLKYRLDDIVYELNVKDTFLEIYHEINQNNLEYIGTRPIDKEEFNLLITKKIIDIGNWYNITYNKFNDDDRPPNAIPYIIINKDEDVYIVAINYGDYDQGPGWHITLEELYNFISVFHVQRLVVFRNLKYIEIPKYENDIQGGWNIKG